MPRVPCRRDSRPAIYPNQHNGSACGIAATKEPATIRCCNSLRSLRSFWILHRLASRLVWFNFHYVDMTRSVCQHHCIALIRFPILYAGHRNIRHSRQWALRILLVENPIFDLTSKCQSKARLPAPVVCGSVGAQSQLSFIVANFVLSTTCLQETSFHAWFRDTR